MNKDTLSVAKTILEKYPIWTIRENKSMWIYDNEKGLFRPNAETYLGKLCVKNLLPKCFYGELIFVIRNMTWIDINDFESYPDFINLKNGVYDIVNDKILQLESKYKFKYNLDIQYDSSALCPKFDAMIKSMTKNKEDYDLIQRWFGYQLFRSNSKLEKKSLFINGEPDVGKSTLLWVLQQINGEGNYTTHSLRDISNDVKYYIADLYGKSANINADISSMGPKDVSTFKQLTGGDPVTARKIHGMPFKFLNQAKFTFACNRFPLIKEPALSDKAFWNRIMVVTAQKAYEQEDKSIRDKLRAELPGILNWTINGLKEYQRDGFNCYDKTWEKTKEIWVKNSTIDDKLVSDVQLLKFPMREG